MLTVIILRDHSFKKNSSGTKFRYNSVKSIRRYIGVMYEGILMYCMPRKLKSHKNRLKT